MCSKIDTFHIVISRYNFENTFLYIQLRGAQILDVVRLHKNGFPENMTFGEFWRKYKVLSESPNSMSGNLPVEKLKSAVQDLLEELDLDHTAVRLGNTQVRSFIQIYIEDAIKFKYKLNIVVIKYNLESIITLIENVTLLRGYITKRC